MNSLFANKIHPFFFPTSIMLVDDDEDYLQMLPLVLDTTPYCRTFSSPSAALLALDSITNSSLPEGSWLYRWKDTPLQSKELIELDVTGIHRVVYDPQRFAEVSVVVVDYFMGGDINGVEFCQKLNNPNLGRILLTGRANDSVAIEAFNRGIIDRFIRKHDEDAFSQLNTTILELQQRYFKKVGGLVSEALTLSRFDFLRDPAFLSVFENLITQLQPVEYYVCCNPTGILLLSTQGQGQFLLIQTEEDLLAQYHAAMEQGASAEVLHALRTGEALPWCDTLPSGHMTTMSYAKVRLVPATLVQGSHCYFYSLIEQPLSFKLNMIKPYSAWLQEMDDQLGIKGL